MHIPFIYPVSSVHYKRIPFVLTASQVLAGKNLYSFLILWFCFETIFSPVSVSFKGAPVKSDPNKRFIFLIWRELFKNPLIRQKTCYL